MYRLPYWPARRSSRMTSSRTCWRVVTACGVQVPLLIRECWWCMMIDTAMSLCLERSPSMAGRLDVCRAGRFAGDNEYDCSQDEDV
jgi:hypothetical protein